MNSTWRSFVWKEWREHRWILATLTSLFGAIALFYGLLWPQSVLSVLTMAFVLCVPLAAALIASGIAAREQSAGTVAFLQALPVSMARPAAAKLILAGFSVVAPIVMAVAIAAACIWLRGYASSDLEGFDQMFWPMPWGLANRYLALIVAPSLAGLSFLLWIAAASVNRSDEVRAGAIGLLVVATCWAVVVWMSEGLELGRERWFGLVVAAAPGGPGAVTPGGDMVLAALVVLASHGALAGWFLQRFGRLPSARKQAIELGQTKADRSWLAPPRRSPWTAIVWKQTRESGPLALMAAAGIIAAHAALAWNNYADMHRVAIDELIKLCLVIWLISGILIAVVSGIGVFIDDLQPRLHAFWRSRPINVDQWFWLKFSVGLVLTIGTLALALAPLAAIVFGIRAANDNLPTVFEEAPQLIGVGIAVQVGTYCAAVTAMAVLRQAVYAAFAALAAVIAIAVVLSTAQPAIQVGPLASILSTLLLLTTIGAWTAVRNDWGWKH